MDAVFAFIERNVRVPRQVLGDVRAQLAACTAGEKALLQLIEQYGTERFAACLDALLDQAERLARNAIRAMPDGSYSFEDWIDDDGIDPCRDSDHGDDHGRRRPPDRRLHRQRCPGQGRHQLADALHEVGGLRLRPAPHRRRPPEQRGLLPADRGDRAARNDRQPGDACRGRARGLTGFRAANAVFGALAKIAPDRVFACEMGGDTGVSFGGYDADRRPFVFLEFLFGSWGGRPTGMAWMRHRARWSISRTTRSRSSKPSTLC